LKRVASRSIASIVVIIFLLQPSLVKRFALVFSCVQLGEEPGSFFMVAIISVVIITVNWMSFFLFFAFFAFQTESLETHCWSHTHWLYILEFGLPLFLLYVVRAVIFFSVISI
jgi:hypothetical protein